MSKKKCKGKYGCGLLKNISEFSNNIRSKDGKQSMCSDCHKKRNNNGHNAELNPRKNNYFIKDYPAPLKAIYGIIDEKKYIVYIGESKYTNYRLYRHFNSGKGNTTLYPYRNENWSYIILWDGTDYDKQERLFRESVLIQALKPKYNKQWNQSDN